MIQRSRYRSRAMVVVEQWGRLHYGTALERQVELAAEVAAGRRRDTLVVVEHPPTITLGRHAPESDLLADSASRSRLGIETVRTDRGGRATYHGPGQLVVYPIVHLARRGLGVKEWVSLLQACLIDVIAAYGVEGTCREGQPGVWVRDAKIASIGLRVARGVSYHGVSLNVGLDVSGFDCIVPCGAAGERITSLAAESSSPPTLEEAAEHLVAVLVRRLRARIGEKDSVHA